jgi:hypothetical protein
MLGLFGSEQVAGVSARVNRKKGRFRLTLPQAPGDNEAIIREETEQ